MKPAYTAGPWHIGMKPGPMIYGPKGEQIADMRPDRAMVPDDENRANARLIAAAPELLRVALLDQEASDLLFELADCRDGTRIKEIEDRLDIVRDEKANVRRAAIAKAAE